MKFNFVFDEFTEDKWQEMVAGHTEPETASIADDFFGCVRVGDIAVDVIYRHATYDSFEANLYVLNEERSDNLAYDYTKDGIPYEEADGVDISFAECKTYEDACKAIEAKVADHIVNGKYDLFKNTLAEHATRETVIW